MKQIIVIFLFTVFSCLNTSDSNAVKVISSEEFKAKIQNKDVQLIDVRTPKEFNTNHIEGARNIDFYSDEFTIQFNKLNKEQPVYVYCRSGRRSRQASKKLDALGFKEIFDLEGGILNFK